MENKELLLQLIKKLESGELVLKNNAKQFYRGSGDEKEHFYREKGIKCWVKDCQNKVLIEKADHEKLKLQCQEKHTRIVCKKCSKSDYIHQLEDGNVKICLECLEKVFTEKHGVSYKQFRLDKSSEKKFIRLNEYCKIKFDFRENLDKFKGDDDNGEVYGNVNYSVKYSPYGSRLEFGNSFSAKKVLENQKEIKNSPDFYQQAPFLTIAEDLLKLIKEDKVDRLIFLSAYDKRKFPNGDDRKIKIFGETFGKVVGGSTDNNEDTAEGLLCAMKLIPFEMIDDNPNICKGVMKLNDTIRKNEVVSKELEEEISEVLEKEDCDFCGRKVERKDLMGFCHENLNPIYGIQQPISEDFVYLYEEDKIKVLTPCYLATESQHHEEVILVKQEVNKLSKMNSEKQKIEYLVKQPPSKFRAEIDMDEIIEKTGDAETADNKEIIIKDYSEAKTTFIGLPLLLVLGIITYFVFFRYSEKEEETAVVDYVGFLTTPTDNTLVGGNCRHVLKVLRARNSEHALKRISNLDEGQINLNLFRGFINKYVFNPLAYSTPNMAFLGSSQEILN
ncbi:14176_t:CDS:10 [Funneliformis geosporum]|uniref:14176_t:CDS:1 n=1 Tax=Funneliformis geosporum TaxID=1117311 RepID=A0A9W4WT01_9GLOM|nr:14176_t:CDS:10 [Funneliformis geosporum]